MLYTLLFHCDTAGNKHRKFIAFSFQGPPGGIGPTGQIGPSTPVCVIRLNVALTYLTHTILEKLQTGFIYH